MKKSTGYIQIGELCEKDDLEAEDWAAKGGPVCTHTGTHAHAQIAHTAYTNAFYTLANKYVIYTCLQACMKWPTHSHTLIANQRTPTVHSLSGVILSLVMIYIWYISWYTWDIHIYIYIYIYTVYDLHIVENAFSTMTSFKSILLERPYYHQNKCNVGNKALFGSLWLTCPFIIVHGNERRDTSIATRVALKAARLRVQASTETAPARLRL